MDLVLNLASDGRIALNLIPQPIPSIDLGFATVYEKLLFCRSGVGCERFVFFKSIHGVLLAKNMNVVYV